MVLGKHILLGNLDISPLPLAHTSPQPLQCRIGSDKDCSDFTLPSEIGNFPQSLIETRDPQTLSRDLVPIPWESPTRQCGFRKVKTQPCPPPADLGLRAGHATGKVLKMTNRIAKIATLSGGGFFENPYQRPVGRRGRLEFRFVTGEAGHPGFVKLENRLRGFARQPVRLGVAQGIPIKLPPPDLAMSSRQREIVDPRNFREVRAGMRIDGGKLMVNAGKR